MPDANVVPLFATDSTPGHPAPLSLSPQGTPPTPEIEPRHQLRAARLGAVASAGFLCTAVASFEVIAQHGLIDAVWLLLALGGFRLGMAATLELRASLRAAQERAEAERVHRAKVAALRNELWAALIRLEVDADLEDVEELLARIVARVEGVA